MVSKCAHASCSCQVEGKKFCSDECQTSLMKPEAAAVCSCDHLCCKEAALIAV
jgi:hypothetical protein